MGYRHPPKSSFQSYVEMVMAFFTANILIAGTVFTVMIGLPIMMCCCCCFLLIVGNTLSTPY